MLTNRKVIEYLFFAVLSGIGSIGVSYVKQISDTMTTLSKSVSELNVRMELISQKMSVSDESIKDHEVRLRHLEIVPGK